MRPLIILAALLTAAVAAPGAVPFDARDNHDDYHHDNDNHHDKDNHHGDNGRCPRVPNTDDGTLPSSTSRLNVIAYVSRKNPNKSFGSQNDGKITPGDMCTVNQFKVEYKKGRECALVVCIPDYKQLKDRNRKLYEFRGPGRFLGASFEPNTRINPHKINWKDMPEEGNFREIVWQPGKCYVIRDFEPLPEPKKGDKYTYISGVTCSNDTKFTWEQSKDDYACPLGYFHITRD